MSRHFTGLIDPYRCCESGKHFAGSIPLSEFPRLRGLLFDSSGDAAFVLDFGRDAPRRLAIHGWVRAHLTLECQRCREAMGYDLESTISLSPVSGLEEAEALPEEYDPLLLDEPKVTLLQLLEDELLLSLPQVPRHEDDTCRAALPEPEPDQVTETGDNPFAALAALKRTH